MSAHFVNTPVFLQELTTAATPVSGIIAFYAKTDNKLYYKDDLGVEATIGADGYTDQYVEYLYIDAWVS